MLLNALKLSFTVRSRAVLVANKNSGLRAAFTGGIMKLIALKPIYFGGTVVTEGLQLETLEQHGRELIKKGYAMSDETDNTEQPEQPEQPESKADKKAKK